jgi:hypothetical protein
METAGDNSKSFIPAHLHAASIRFYSLFSQLLASADQGLESF